MVRRRPKQPSRTREYRVQLTAWETYEIRIRASDEASACGDARHMWLELGPEVFRYRDGGVNDVVVLADQEADA